MTSDLQSCSRCRHDNPSNSLFCAQCGNSLQAAATVEIVNQHSLEVGGDHPALGWHAAEQVTAVTLRPSESSGREVVDAAKCPQCGSPQTQSFEMAYSMATSSGTT